MDEIVAAFVEDLEDDAVGMWQIVPAANDFRLEGQEKVAFIRRVIGALVDAGARPVHGGAGTEYYWLVQPKYGETKEAIIEAVVGEWLAEQPDQLTLLGGVWFATPDFYNIKWTAKRP